MAKWIRRKLWLTVFIVICSIDVSAELVVIVHPDNPVPALTQAQLKRIFLGRMPFFPGTEEEIVALDLPPSDPGFGELYRKVAKLNVAELTRYRAYYLFSGRGNLPKKMDSASAVVEEVSNNRRAIGYVDRSFFDDTVRALMNVAE